MPRATRRFAHGLRRDDRDRAVEECRPHRVAAWESQPVRLGDDHDRFDRGSRTGNQHFQDRPDSAQRRRHTEEQRQVAPADKGQPSNSDDREHDHRRKVSTDQTDDHSDRIELRGCRPLHRARDRDVARQRSLPCGSQCQGKRRQKQDQSRQQPCEDCSRLTSLRRAGDPRSGALWAGRAGWWGRATPMRTACPDSSRNS